MEYKVVNEEWDLDFGKKPLEECVIFESENLDDCTKYAQDNSIPESRVVKNNGRIATGDWYGVYDNDLGWEYD
jgi:hypothetical protein